MALETLVCETCEQDWQRERVRGRKPKQCPPCKDDGAVPSRATRYKEDDEGTYTLAPARAAHAPTESVEPIGPATPYMMSRAADNKYQIYNAYSFGEEHVTGGDLLVHVEDGDLYKFRTIVVRPDGTAYCNVVGESGPYQSKYRAIDVQLLATH